VLIAGSVMSPDLVEAPQLETAPVDVLLEEHAAGSAVVFDRVSFAFDEHVVLRDVSLPSRRGA
jgi:hypothetical protein